MIQRYQSSQIGSIFSEKNRLSIYLDIEAALLEVLSKRHPITGAEIKRLKNLKPHIDLKAIEENEAKTRHDITAFLTWVWQRLPNDKGVQRFLHFGLTSSDLVDTALALQIKTALETVIVSMDPVLKTLKALALKYAKEPTIGRTHGIHAEVTSLGLKFLSFYTEGVRQQNRLRLALGEINYGKLSGSVGSFASSAISPQEEEKILSRLGLKAEPVSTQIVPRDRHLVVMARMAIAAGWVERIATEIRHLQRTEVGEAAEPFNEGSQQGSSSMPHKRNPVLCENLCGLTRLMRGYSISSMENTALWHERDISHSSAERVAIPDAFHLMHFMMRRLLEVVGGLKVNRAAVKRNLHLLMDLPASQKYLHTLVASGIARKDAYYMIQRASFKALENKSSLYEELKKENNLKSLRRFQERDFLAHVPAIFKRSLAR